MTQYVTPNSMLGFACLTLAICCQPFKCGCDEQFSMASLWNYFV